mmetsp:Transcript_46087/g.137740  ORF Transcript_46087/g.137740 Transcript_46087/m.137740 type:complete len:120 (-) Transcript_46087:54-413(-)
MCCLRCSVLALLVACLALVAKGLPHVGLDAPRELVHDVNKPPHPIINVIAETARAVEGRSTAVGAAEGRWSTQEKLWAAEQRSVELSAGHALARELQRLKRLKHLRSLLRPEEQRVAAQ